MTTKELIKLLKKNDPSGKSHVRINDEPVYAVESKEGYWDGAYNYLEEDENGDLIWVQSTENSKVDIITMDMFSFIERYKGDWDKIESHIKINYGYLDKTKEENFLREFQQECIEYNKIETRLYNQALNEMINNAKKGWKWFQNKDVDASLIPNEHVYYTWLIYDENGEKQPSNVWKTKSILISGMWTKTDNGVKKGYYEWIYNENKLL